MLPERVVSSAGVLVHNHHDGLPLHLVLHSALLREHMGGVCGYYCYINS